MRRKRLLIYGANAVLLILIVLGILAALNYLSIKRGGRYDVTEGKLYSLSDQTLKVVAGLKGEIKVLAFFKEVGVDRRAFQDLINQYRRRAKRIKVEYIDPDKEPGIAKKYEVNEYGAAVLVSGEETVKLALSDPISGGIVDNAEEEITNALIKLSKGVRNTVYFLTGHGERDIKDESEPEGFGRIKKALEGEAYEVEELLLARKAAVPKENSILVVAGPKKSLLEKEVQSIKKYLDEGGKAVFLIEPRGSADLIPFLKGYGFILGDNVIIDPSSKLVGGGDIAPIVSDYAPHDITDDFKFATLFPYGRTVDPADKDGVSPTLLAKTSEYSWAETDFDLFDQGVAEQDGEDKAGPLGVVVVSEIGKKARIAVFGSLDFISNRFFDFSGNSDFFLNTINWLTGDEHLISVRPKAAKEGKLSLTGNQMRAVFAVTVILLPAAVLFSGIAVWWKRRNM